MAPIMERVETKEASAREDMRTIRKQTYRRVERPTMVASLQELSKASRSLVRVHLSKLGLELGQDELFLRLSQDNTPISISLLAEQLQIQTPTTSKMCERLQEKGHIHRTQNADDRRVIEVHLTTKGLEMAELVGVAHRHVEKLIQSQLQEQNLEITAEALKQLASVLRDAIPHAR